ncbi:MAG: type I-C CRISPR-associated protein Cas7/Csd2 [Epulopiscium sp.]|nr:type I-C CRISPR-associated protein Cas7/Csd2 [Candidatus Epulonipiscium sp.]
MLNNKYDFLVVLSVKNANPNGDPLNGNRPRINYDGIGEISDVCIKRKIRNRLMQNGKRVFVQSDDNKMDGYKSLKERAEKTLPKDVLKDKDKLYEAACKEWIDVRAFGQVFAFKGGETKGVSTGVRGPISIQSAFSVSPINTTSIQITKSVNSEGDGKNKSSDTMGMKHRVDFGLYTFAGSINPQLASKTGLDDKDVEDIKTALIELFENDASSARPEGSMEIMKVFWWKHNSPNGQYSSAKVHKSVKINLKKGIVEPKEINDYVISVEPLKGLEMEEIDGR